jgi:hypothetical protein
MMGLPQDFTGCPIAYLCSIGVTAEAAKHIISTLKEEGPTLQKLGVHEHIIGLVRSLHTKSWFKFGASSNVIVAKKGGRQGCRFGGKCFNFNYAVALLEVRTKLLERNIAIRIVASSTSTEGINSSEVPRLTLSPIDDATAVIDITFVDDEAIAICAAVPGTLCKHVNFAIETIVATFAKFNFTVNFSKGKTELMVKFRGKNAKSCKESLTQGSEFLWSLTDDARLRSGAEALHVVDKYKHLGSIVEVDGSLMLEATSRVGRAMNAFAPIAGKIFGSPRINLERKLILAWSLVFSRLFFSVHVWSKFEGKPRQTIQTMYMRVLRRILGRPRYKAGGVTDLFVRTKLIAMSIDCIMRRARLKYIARLVRSGTHIVLNLVSQVDGDTRLPWMKLLISDFSVLRLELPRIFVDCPRFDEDPDFYYRMMRNCPNEWKQIVDTYKTSLNDTENPLLSTSGLDTQVIDQPIITKNFACNLCDHGTAIFRTSKALQAHRRTKHVERSAIIQYIADTSVFPVFKVDFQSRLRLVTHASDSRIRSKTRGTCCRNEILHGAFPLVPEDELTRLNLRDRDGRRAAAKAGHSHEMARVSAKKPQGQPHILSKRSDVQRVVRRRISHKRSAPEYDSSNKSKISAKRRRCY